MGAIFGLIAALFGYMIVLVLAADFLRKFGLPMTTGAPFTLGMLVMLALALFASAGFRERKDPIQQLILVCAFIAAWMIVVSFPHVVVIVAFVGVFFAVYLKALIVSWNYYFVRRPLEQQAIKEQMLDKKLNADAAVAEATLRRERARAALADAEQEFRAVQGQTGSKR
jgi:hypothetical protein